MTSTHGSQSVDTRWFQGRLFDKHISQRKLAKSLGLDPAAVSLMLRGKRKMSAAEVAEIARLLGVSIEEVMTRAGVAPTIPSKRKSVMVPHHVDATTTPVPAAPGPAPSQTDMLEIPVPMSDGSTARLTVPRVMTKVDAERIAALVAAFAQP